MESKWERNLQDCIRLLRQLVGVFSSPFSYRLLETSAIIFIDIGDFVNRKTVNIRLLQKLYYRRESLNARSATISELLLRTEDSEQVNTLWNCNGWAPLVAQDFEVRFIIDPFELIFR